MDLLIMILAALVGILLYKNMVYRRALREFGEFLNKAVDGEEISVVYDEKESSKLKNLLLKFLNAKQVRELKVIEEKEKTNMLISDISHQTKTPIANLSIYLDLLEKGYKLEYIETLRYELNKLSFLIDNLVKSSRMEVGMIRLHKKTIDMSILVNDVINEFKEIAQLKNIKINYSFEKIIMSLDEKWTKEAVHNLIDNAIKYCSENGEVEITIKKSHIFYRLSISNDSEDLLLEDRSKIFQRFYRGKNSINKEGLGLGLFITRTIIEKQEGMIHVDSNGNKIKFCVDFPI